MKTTNSKIKKVFTDNPDIEVLWQTSDGQIFLNKGFALAHSISENGKKRDRQLQISEIKRKDIDDKQKTKKTVQKENKQIDKNKKNDK